MRLYLCAIITLLEMFDTSFISAIIGKFMEIFTISYAQLSDLYISLALGAAISLPLTKYCYQAFNLKQLYKFLIIILMVNFTWAFFTSNWSIFCLLRAVQGFCLTLLYSLSFLDVVTTSDNKDNDINLINGISILGLISGPALSGYITLIGWNYIFILFNLILSLVLVINHHSDFTQETRLKLLPNPDPGAAEADTTATTSREVQLPPRILNQDESPTTKISVADSLEYLSFILVITLTSLVVDNLLSPKYLSIVVVASLFLIFKYKKFPVNFIFSKEIFNKSLGAVVIIHILCRFSIIALIPLLTSILYQAQNYSTLKISLLLTLSASAALIAKIVYRNLAVVRRQISGVFFIYAIVLSFLALSPFANLKLLSLWLFLYGFFSSIIFNYLNSCIFYRQLESSNKDLAVVLTLLQMLLYGLCTTIVFKLFAYLALTHTSATSLAIVILFMVYSTLLALFIYQKNFGRGLV